MALSLAGETEQMMMAQSPWGEGVGDVDDEEAMLQAALNASLSET